MKMTESPVTIATSRPTAAWLADRPPGRRQTIALAAIVAAAYLVGVIGLWTPTNDSAMYLGLARSLAEGKGYVFNGRVSTQAAPGFPGLLAGIRLLAGPGYFAPNLAITLMGLAGLWLLFVSLRRLSDARIALAVTLCTAWSFPFYYHAHVILTDAPFFAAFWLIVYACARAAPADQSGGALRVAQGAWRWPVLASLSAAAGAFLRAPGLLTLGVFSLGLLCERSGGGLWGRARRGGPLLAATLAAGGALLALARLAGGGPGVYVNSTMEGVSGATAGQRAGMFLEGLWNLALTASESLTGQGGQVMGMLGVPLVALAAVGGVALWRRGQRFVPVTTFGLAIVGSALYGKVGTLPRIMLPVLPLFLYETLQGACAVIGRAMAGAAAERRSRTMLAAAVILVCASLANLPKVLRNGVYYSYLSHAGGYYKALRGGEHAETLAAAEFLADPSRANLSVSAVEGVATILHYLSGHLIVMPPQSLYSPFAPRPDSAEFARRTGTDMVIVAPNSDEKGGADPKGRATAAELERMGMRTAFSGKWIRIYQRLPAATGEN
jgi:hypothetical protein